MYMNTFDQLKSLYDYTKPIKGKRRKTEYDIRPFLSSRDYPCNRVKKFSDTEYGIIVDDFWPVNPERYSPMSDEAYRNMCVVRIEKISDNQDLIHFRIGRHTLINSIRVLNMVLNGQFALRRDGVKEYIAVGDKTRYYLPRNEVHFRAGEISASFAAESDGKTLTLLRTGDTYEPAVELFPDERTVIDKDAKKEFRKGIAAYAEYVAALMPMDDDVGAPWSYYRGVTEGIKQRRNEALDAFAAGALEASNGFHSIHSIVDFFVPVTYYFSWSNSARFTPTDGVSNAGSSEDWIRDEFRAMLKATGEGQDHWMQYLLYKLFVLTRTEDITNDASGYKKMRSRLNQTINKMGNFYKTIIV